MAHSKKNTTRAFFTAHERNELKGSWGTSSTRLTRESFLPFGSCNLCLLQARDPVSCSTEGHLFCRECAISNLLAQKKEIKRLKKEAERWKSDDADDRILQHAAAQAQALKSFERVQAGLDAAGTKRKASDTGNGNTKRRATDTPANQDTSFWIPSQSHEAKQEHQKSFKQRPVCPISRKDTHEFSLKSLVTVHFTEQTTDEHQGIRCCPSCNKILSNTTKAVLATSCGHVLCKSCSDKFQQAPEKSAHDDDTAETARCYVCQEDITPTPAEDAVVGEKADKAAKHHGGLTELKSDGTGFAGGGDNMVKREGLAFQFG